MPVYNLGVIPTKPSPGGFFGQGMLAGLEEERKKQSPEYRLMEMKLKALQDADAALRTQALTGVSPFQTEQQRMTINALQQLPEFSRISALTKTTPEDVTIGGLSPEERRVKFGMSPEQLKAEQTKAELLGSPDMWKRMLGAQSLLDKMKGWADLYGQDWFEKAFQTKALVEDPYGKQEAKLEAQKANLAKLYAQLYKQEAAAALKRAGAQPTGKPVTQASATKSLVNLATDLDKALAPSGLPLKAGDAVNVVKDRAAQTLNILNSLPEGQRFDEKLEMSWVAPYVERLTNLVTETADPKVQKKAAKAAFDIFERLSVEEEPTPLKLGSYVKTATQIFDSLPSLEGFEKETALTIAAYKQLFGNEMAMQATGAFEPLFDEKDFEKILGQTASIVKKWQKPSVETKPKTFGDIISPRTYSRREVQ